MPISQADQEAVWATETTLLSDNAKTVFQVMADTDDTYGVGAAETISTQLGGSLDSAEVAAALNELWTKGYLQVDQFVPRYPPIPGPVTGGG